MRISDWSSDVCSSDLDAPDSIPVLRQPLEAVIGLERIAAVADEAEHAREGVVGQRRIGQRAAYLVAHFRRAERRGARARHHVLGEHVEPAGAERLVRSEEHTSELQSLMRISYAVLCLHK